MRKNTKKHSNKNKNKTVQISKTINLNNSSVRTKVCVTTVLFWYDSTPQVSFSTGSDTRYFGFSQVTTGTYPFQDFATVYDTFKVLGASAIVTPYSNTTFVLPPLHLSCDPDAPPANPTNSTLINSMTSHLFSINQIGSKAVSFSFPGVGTGVREWQDVATPPTGSFYVGMNVTSIGSPTTGLCFEITFILDIMFRGIRSR
jgi:hypothetical protein